MGKLEKYEIKESLLLTKAEIQEIKANIAKGEDVGKYNINCICYISIRNKRVTLSKSFCSYSRLFSASYPERSL